LKLARSRYRSPLPHSFTFWVASPVAHSSFLLTFLAFFLYPFFLLIGKFRLNLFDQMPDPLKTKMRGDSAFKIFEGIQSVVERSDAAQQRELTDLERQD
jgi:hypothetical protein